MQTKDFFYTTRDGFELYVKQYIPLACEDGLSKDSDDYLVIVNSNYNTLNVYFKNLYVKIINNKISKNKPIYAPRQPVKNSDITPKRNIRIPNNAVL